MEKIIEIRPCAGGKESECLCREMLAAYTKYCSKNNIEISLSDAGKTTVFFVKGKEKVLKAFDNESGVHKFQRVAKTEKNGRVQTSTISVAVMDVRDDVDYEHLYKPEEIKMEKFHCGGPGGQNVNKVETGIRLIHIPTGTVVHSTEERSQYQNKINAYKMLAAKLASDIEQEMTESEKKKRTEQVKGGSRADARRVYNEQRSEIVDKITGKRCSYKEFFKGNINLL